MTNILYFSRTRALLSGEEWIGYLKISKNKADREQVTRLEGIMSENHKKLTAEDAVIEAKRKTDAAKDVMIDLNRRKSKFPKFTKSNVDTGGPNSEVCQMRFRIHSD